jgi:hypothetical protein
MLVGCASASPSFVKLDASGKRDAPANPETLERDVADCKVLEAHVRAEAGTFFETSSARMAFDNCMRSKGYIKSYISDGEANSTRPTTFSASA